MAANVEKAVEQPAYNGLHTLAGRKMFGRSRQEAETTVAEAILLVGGKGTRLRPVTVYTPKPMVRAAGVPFLAHQLARAAAVGVDHIVLATSYLAKVFEPYFGDGSSLGVHLEYVTEKEPLGTGGAIRNAAARLNCGPDEPVLVFNSRSVLTRAVVGDHAVVGADNELRAGVRVWCDARIPARALRSSSDQ